MLPLDILRGKAVLYNMTKGGPQKSSTQENNPNGTQSTRLALDLYFSCHFESLHFTWEFSNDTSKDYIQYYKLSAMIKETKCTHFVSFCNVSFCKLNLY